MKKNIAIIIVGFDRKRRGALTGRINSELTLVVHKAV
jgi:hypothetical protein